MVAHNGARVVVPKSQKKPLCTLQVRQRRKKSLPQPSYLKQAISARDLGKDLGTFITDNFNSCLLPKFFFKTKETVNLVAGEWYS